MRGPTKRGYHYQKGGTPIKGRKSHGGYRDMFEDREMSRKKSQNLKYRLTVKYDKWDYEPEKYAPLTETEEKILENMKNMQNHSEWKESTDQYRSLCIGSTGTMARYHPLKYRMGGKEISHPEDSTFKKRVKILNDDGRKKLERKRNKKVQAIA